MKISQEGIDQLIKSYEGLSLKPYFCPAGKLTIGYGHVMLKGEKIEPITLQQAEQLLLNDLSKFNQAVNDLVKVPINQSQFDALVSLCYNIGIEAFKQSTLLKKLNSHANL